MHDTLRQFARTGYPDLKASLLVMFVCLSGCAWFHTKKPLPPEPTQLIVTGAPPSSILFIDGVRIRQVDDAGNRPQVLDVAPGTHTLEVRAAGDKFAYRENLDIGVGERRIVTVLSGASRN